MKNKVTLILFSLAVLLLGMQSFAADHLVFEGEKGPGKGKHIVFLAGDEEYRSEEAMPLMAQIMVRQGFKCTVLFSIDEKTGFVSPNNQKSLTNPAALDTADAIVMSLRFRNWNDDAMQKFENALMRGVPMIGLRTTTHAFKFPKNSKWFKYSFNASKETGWHKGFGRQVMGETWVSHHGRHKKEGTRSVVEAANKANEILNGVGTIFGTTDVYGANPPADSIILLRGAVTKTLDPQSAAVEGKKNSPMQPIVWTREYTNAKGKVNRVFTTTMGASTDLTDENLRRVIGNGILWSLKLAIPAKLDVSLPGLFAPNKYSNNIYKKNLKPEGFILTGKPEGKK